ncbi:transmembrane protein PMIS2 [Psammomys obesus]|uniref:transmembrane protein PMIS2 n=1 Tax=Psammomys obesus TaxID=48139 RepID=UPI002452A0A4|nr:transmembrane protein PMIS2 [Psammomys obesus]
MDTPAPAKTSKKPLDREQTSEEKAFYARNHFVMTVLALILFPPLGLGGLYYSRKTDEANKSSDWEDAYHNSTRTIFFDVFGIMIGLGLIYVFVLVL